MFVYVYMCEYEYIYITYMHVCVYICIYMFMYMRVCVYPTPLLCAGCDSKPIFNRKEETVVRTLVTIYQVC